MTFAYKLSDITNYNANVRVDTLSSDIAKHNFCQSNLRCANFRNIYILLKLFVSYFLYSSHRKELFILWVECKKLRI